MSTFEILCVTMNQNDFSKVIDMNIHSDVVFANQADRTELTELSCEGHKARMITTQTRGVGVNRNLALLHAQGDICLLADDDVEYYDDMEERILSEFAAHPDGDIIIFHLDSTDPVRIFQKAPKTKRLRFWNRAPSSAVRIAFRLSAVKKGNIWFTTLCGGGCTFPSGEDSMWLNTARKKGLRMYVSTQTIGKVSYETSTWFTGYDRKFFYGKGAYHQAVHPHTTWLWKQYILFRFRKFGTMASKERIEWFSHGAKGYRKLLSYDEYVECLENRAKCTHSGEKTADD